MQSGGYTIMIGPLKTDKALLSKANKNIKDCIKYIFQKIFVALFLCSCTCRDYSNVKKLFVHMPSFSNSSETSLTDA